MDASLAEGIWRGVVERVEAAPGLDPWRTEHFEELRSVASRVDGAESLEPTELAAATTVAWLRGRRGGPLRSAEVDGLCLILREIWPNEEHRRIERAVDVGIAVGCGVGGTFGERADLHERPWGGAWTAVLEAVGAAVAEVDRWLLRLDIPRRGRRVQDEQVRTALVLTDALTAPGREVAAEGLRVLGTSTGACLSLESLERHETDIPHGAKFALRVLDAVRLHAPRRSDVIIVPADTRLVASSLDDSVLVWMDSGPKPVKVTLEGEEEAVVKGPARVAVRKCRCGNVQCAERHHLAAWDPAGDVTLRSFIASAVKGPRRSLGTNSLLQSMYVPLLAFEGDPRVRGGDVEFSVCGACGSTYQGDHCPVCATPFDRSAMLRIRRPWLIPSGLDPEPYRREQRFDCPERDLHFERLDGRMPPAGPSARARNLYKPEGVGPDELEDAYRRFRELDEQAPRGAASGESGAEQAIDAPTSVSPWDCPLCGHTPYPRASKIWARTQVTRVSWEDIEDEEPEYDDLDSWEES